MGRKRKYTPETLRRAVKRYFRSITRRVRKTEMVPTGERDDKGHMIFMPVIVYNDLGEELWVTEYLVPPSVEGLCVALGIHPGTWENYCKDEAYRETTDWADARMRAWNAQEMLTRPGKDIKGILFNLQNNYGYGGEKHEFTGDALRLILEAANGD